MIRKVMSTGIGLLLFTLSQAVTANDEWWFDIEVIVFERSPGSPVQESFASVDEIPHDYAYDLFSQAMRPNINGLIRALPSCEMPPEPSLTLEQVLQRYTQWQQAQTALTNSLTDTEEAVLDESVMQQQQSPQSPAPTEIAPFSNEVLPMQAVQSEQAIDYDDAQTMVENRELTNESDPVAAEVLSVLALTESIEPSLIERQQQLIDLPKTLLPLTIPARFDCISSSEIESQTDDGFYLVDNRLATPTRVPKTPIGAEWLLPDFSHFLPSEARQLTEFANQLERLRGHRVLSHSVWRQPVLFGRDIAPAYRLIAGENYQAYAEQKKVEPELVNDDSASESDNIEATTNSDPFFAQLRSALSSPIEEDIVAHILAQPDTDDRPAENQTVEPLWAVDGEFKVYLQYINSVPYLHIDSELVYQREIGQQSLSQAPELQAVPFKQLRRVISQQVHYFDHPLFGLVVQIRRHQRPTIDSEDEIE